MMRDLLEKLNQLTLNEAPVKPGEKKGISFTLKKLDKMGASLRDYKNSLALMQQSTMPPDLKKEMDQLKEKLNGEIEKVQRAYDDQYAKSTSNDRPVKMDNLFKALAKNCKDIIKVYKELNRNNFDREKFLFRGVRSSDDALYGVPFDARKPKDSNLELHELVNDTIRSLGFDANRENAMFVTGDRSQASGYGNSLYIMFPVDGFTFTWSQRVKDLVLDSSKKLEMIDKNVVKQIKDVVKAAKKESENPEEFPIKDPDDLFYSGYNYDQDYRQLSVAANQGVLPKKIKELLDNLLTDESIQEHFEFTDSNLFNAILSEKEIYIKGPYYAVKYEHKDELFKFLKQLDTDSVELPENFGEVPNIIDRGDVVTILRGNYEGKLGTVTYVYSTELDVFITTQTGDVTIPKTDVDLYKFPDGSIPIYEKGDQVIVIDPDSRQYGMSTKLNFVYPTGKVEFADDQGNFFTAFKNQIAPYSEQLEKEILKDLETKPPMIQHNDNVVVIDQDSEFYGQRGKVNYVYGTGTIEVNLQNKNQYIDFKPDQLALLDNAPPGLLKKEPGVFNLGDKVRITNGEYSNYIGKVIYIYSGSPKLEVDLIGLDKRVDIWIDDLEHYETPNDNQTEQPKSDKLEKGDTVKITQGSNAGKTGVVTYVYNTSPEVAVKVEGESTDQDYQLTAVQKIDPPVQPAAMGNFKVGDIVVIKEPSSKYNGKVGRITQASNAAGVVDVKFKDGGNSLFYVSELQPYDAPKITQPLGKLKVGDLVQVIEPDSSYYQKQGEVVEIGQTESGNNIVTIVTDGTLYKTFMDWVKKVDTASEKASTSIAVGDTVKVNAGPSKGEIGKVVFDYSPIVDEVTVEFELGNKEDFEISNLDKIQTQPDDIDNLNWEPEPEVQSPTPKFAVNDKVEVVSMFPSLIGKTGTILQVSPNYDFVSVQIDDNNATSSFPTASLKKLTGAPLEQTVADFTQGDRVQVTNSKLSTYGKQGKVIDINPAYLFVEFPDQSEAAVKPNSVKKIG